MASTFSFLQLHLPHNLKISPLSSSSSSRSLNNNNNISSRRTFCLTTSTSSSPSPISPISVNSNIFGDSNVNPSSSRENANAGVCFGSAGSRAMVFADEDETEDDLIRRFKREVSKAGIIPECRRRRHHENRQEEKKRKFREAGMRNRRRKFGPRPYPYSEGEGKVVAKKNDDNDDNWNMPAGGLP